MSLLDVGKLAIITLTPTLVGAAVVFAPRGWATLCRIWPKPAPEPEPLGPPIEQLAADLRRLLRLHQELTSSAHVAMLAHRLWAVEAAIGDRAIEAARALDVPHREIRRLEVLSRAELGELLRALSNAGLVLPAAVAPFTKDGRL